MTLSRTPLVVVSPIKRKEKEKEKKYK